MNIKSNSILILDLLAFAKDGASKGCLMAMMGKDLQQKLTTFSNKHISDSNLAGDGKETEHHVTVLYGFDFDFETEPLKAFLENQESIAFELGSVSRFECPDYDVLKAEVISPDAQKLHYALKDKFKNSIQTTYPIYHAHATLAYVKKGSHKELDGHEGLKGEKFSVSSLLYSLPDKVGRKNLSLKG